MRESPNSSNSSGNSWRLRLSPARVHPALLAVEELKRGSQSNWYWRSALSWGCCCSMRNRCLATKGLVLLEVTPTPSAGNRSARRDWWALLRPRRPPPAPGGLIDLGLAFLQSAPSSHAGERNRVNVEGTQSSAACAGLLTPPS